MREQEANLRRLKPEVKRFDEVPSGKHHFWMRRSYREFLGKRPSLPLIKDSLSSSHWENALRRGAAMQGGSAVNVTEVTAAIKGSLLQLLSQQQDRFAYASAGAARAVTTWLLKGSDGRQKRFKYLSHLHGLEVDHLHAGISADLAHDLPSDGFVVCFSADLHSESLQKYDLPMRTILMKQEIGCMEAVLDEAASEHGWAWRLCQTRSSKEVVECAFLLVTRSPHASPACSLTMHFLDFSSGYCACSEGDTFVDVADSAGVRVVERWTKLREEQPPHNKIVAEQASWMLEVKASPLAGSHAADLDVVIGKIAQLVMMIPVRCNSKDVLKCIGWCPIYLGSSSMLLLGGPISSEQVHSPQVFWSRDWALKLLKGHLESQLPQHFQPDEMILQKLPLSSNDKVDYGKLRRLAEDRKKPQHPQQAVEKSMIEEWLLAEIRRFPKLGNCQLDDNFIQLGLKSREVTAVANAVSQKFKVKLNPTNLFHQPTVRRLASVILEPDEEVPTESPAPAATRPSALKPVSTPLAIVTMSLRSPGNCSSADAFWEALREGVDQVCPAPPQRISLGLLQRHAGLLGLHLETSWKSKAEKSTVGYGLQVVDYSYLPVGLDAPPIVEP